MFAQSVVVMPAGRDSDSDEAPRPRARERDSHVDNEHFEQSRWGDNYGVHDITPSHYEHPIAHPVRIIRPPDISSHSYTHDIPFEPPSIDMETAHHVYEHPVEPIIPEMTTLDYARSSESRPAIRAVVPDMPPHIYAHESPESRPVIQAVVHDRSPHHYERPMAPPVISRASTHRSPIQRPATHPVDVEHHYERPMDTFVPGMVPHSYAREYPSGSRPAIHAVVRDRSPPQYERPMAPPIISRSSTHRSTIQPPAIHTIIPDIAHHYERPMDTFVPQISHDYLHEAVFEAKSPGYRVLHDVTHEYRDRDHHYYRDMVVQTDIAVMREAPTFSEPMVLLETESLPIEDDEEAEAIYNAVVSEPTAKPIPQLRVAFIFLRFILRTFRRIRVTLIRARSQVFVANLSQLLFAINGLPNGDTPFLESELETINRLLREICAFVEEIAEVGFLRSLTLNDKINIAIGDFYQRMEGVVKVFQLSDVGVDIKFWRSLDADSQVKDYHEFHQRLSDLDEINDEKLCELFVGDRDEVAPTIRAVGYKLKDKSSTKSGESDFLLRSLEAFISAKLVQGSPTAFGHDDYDSKPLQFNHALANLVTTTQASEKWMWTNRLLELLHVLNKDNPQLLEDEAHYNLKKFLVRIAKEKRIQALEIDIITSLIIMTFQVDDSILLRLDMETADTNLTGTALQLAATIGHIAAIKRLTGYGVKLDTKDGESALERAAANGHQAVVEMLIGKKWKVNGYEGLAPQRGARNSWMQPAPLVPANVGQYLDRALKSAVVHGHRALVEFLIAEGAKVGDKDLLGVAAGKGHIAVVELLIESGAGWDTLAYGDALKSAAANGRVAIVELLIEKGVWTDTEVFQSELVSAAAKGKLAIVELLLEKTVGTDAKVFQNALKLAAGNGHLAVVEVLVESGAKTRDAVALKAAVEGGHRDVVQLLVKMARTEPWDGTFDGVPPGIDPFGFCEDRFDRDMRSRIREELEELKDSPENWQCLKNCNCRLRSLLIEFDIASSRSKFGSIKSLRKRLFHVFRDPESGIFQRLKAVPWKLERQRENAVFLQNLLKLILGNKGVSKRSREAFDVYLRVVGILAGYSSQFPSYLFLDGDSTELRYSRFPVAIGGHSDFHMGEYKGDKVSVKFLHVFRKARKADPAVYTEVTLWHELKHPNILPLVGVAWLQLLDYVSPRRFAFVTPWIPGGNILDYLKSHPRTNKLQLMRDVAEGLSYLHSLGLAHQNVKPRNILVDDRYKEVRGVLCDQGLVTLNEDPGYTGSESDSPSYTAPERFSEAGQEGGNSYPLKESDIYSFALSLYHVTTGKVPPQGTPTRRSHSFHEARTKLERPEGLNDSMWELIEKCLQHDPESRPNMAFVLLQLQYYTLNVFTFDRKSPLSPHNRSVHYQDKTYPTIYHLYHAMKYFKHRPELSEKIRLAEDVNEFLDSLGVGAKRGLEKTWDRSKALRDAYLSYFSQYADAKEQLLQTRDRPLLFIDSNDIWGFSAETREGHNYVGRWLMKIRSESV